MADFTGGFFSVLQQVIDMIYQGKTTGNWAFFGANTGAFNIVKFFLGVISIGFDITFMVQHFILYPDKIEIEEVELDNVDKEPLLVERRSY
mmetsp:Transcript_9622/g.8466  ORF Transcript_9622/g.8466 Transcript_9622/m.8466 type:complete len:91 (-) Transcript_9622:41-313(-)